MIAFASKPEAPVLKLRFLAESRGLVPRFFRLAANNMAIKHERSRRELCNIRRVAETAIRRVRFRPRQAGDLLVAIFLGRSFHVCAT
jgi:hypothetical protein